MEDQVKQKLLAYIVSALMISIILLMEFGGLIMAIVFAVKGHWLYAILSLFAAFLGFVVMRMFQNYGQSKTILTGYRNDGVGEGEGVHPPQVSPAQGRRAVRPVRCGAGKAGAGDLRRLRAKAPRHCGAQILAGRGFASLHALPPAVAANGMEKTVFCLPDGAVGDRPEKEDEKMRHLTLDEVRRLPVGARVDLVFDKSGTRHRCTLSLMNQKYKILRSTNSDGTESGWPLIGYTGAHYEEAEERDA